MMKAISPDRVSLGPSGPGSLLNVKSGGEMPRRSRDVATTRLGYYSFSATYS
jgi:hypothetical protein